MDLFQDVLWEKNCYLVPRLNNSGIDNESSLLDLKATIIKKSDTAYEVEIVSSDLNKAVREQLSLERGWVKNLTSIQRQALVKIPSMIIEEGKSKQGETGLLLTFFKVDTQAVNQILNLHYSKPQQPQSTLHKSVNSSRNFEFR